MINWLKTAGRFPGGATKQERNGNEVHGRGMGSGNGRVAGFARDGEPALCYAPIVAADPPDGLVIEVTGCRRYHRLLTLVCSTIF
jgi:hypothetical protein